MNRLEEIRYTDSIHTHSHELPCHVACLLGQIKSLTVENARLRAIEEAARGLMKRLDSEEPPSYLKTAGDMQSIQALRRVLHPEEK